MRTVITTLPTKTYALFVIFVFLHFDHVEAVKSVTPNFKNTKDETLPPCASCKVLIDSFKKGFERTKRGKFEGGDSAWEEDNMGSYKSSELRLIEIQEHLCNEVQNGQSQCHALAEDLEGHIEDWWFNQREAYPDIFDFVCIEKAKRCCPKHHFGSNCEECPGYPSNICNNNGKCKGDGTRKGNGGCLCDKGYSGDSCLQCSPDHYESYKDDNKLLCSPCHVSCNTTCTGPGPRNCDSCADGWRQMHYDQYNECVDINECAQSDKYCPGNQFCVNTEGEYHCLGCDRACNGCAGDGPDMCIKCADNYINKDNICLDAETINKKRTENVARYATYFGLGVATCIIFQRNIYVASLIGIVVGTYITVSEYMIYHNSLPDIGSSINFLHPT